MVSLIANNSICSALPLDSWTRPKYSARTDRGDVAKDCQETIDTMVECFTAYKEQDLSKWLDCFEEDAKIRIYSGGDGVQDDHPMLSKQQYKTWLEAGGHGLQSYNLINPKIRVTGNSAIFICDNLVSGTAIQIESDLINKKDQWKMIKLRWTFRGH